MRSHPGVAAKVFRVLGENGINIEMISTSPIKISCVIAADDVPQAVRALHEAFDLGADAIREEPTGAEHRPAVTRLAMAGDGYRVGVVGATGAVGSHDPRGPRRARFPATEVVPFTSERSAGTKLPFAGGRSSAAR